MQHIWKDAYNFTHLDQKKPKKPSKKLITLTLYMEGKDRKHHLGNAQQDKDVGSN